MTILCISSSSSSSLSSFLSLKIISIPYSSNARPFATLFSRISKAGRFAAMSSSTDFPGRAEPSSAEEIHEVPAIDAGRMDHFAEQAFQRYSSASAKRNGNGVAIVWFRNDLRVLDNEALYKAWISSKEVLPVYCIDPRIFGTTYYFGFPKTGGTLFVFNMKCL